MSQGRGSQAFLLIIPFYSKVCGNLQRIKKFTSGYCTLQILIINVTFLKGAELLFCAEACQSTALSLKASPLG